MLEIDSKNRFKLLLIIPTSISVAFRKTAILVKLITKKFNFKFKNEKKKIKYTISFKLFIERIKIL